MIEFKKGDFIEVTDPKTVELLKKQGLGVFGVLDEGGKWPSGHFCCGTKFTFDAWKIKRAHKPRELSHKPRK